MSGYYGFGNIGDEALLAGLIRVMGTQVMRPTVLSADPVATARDHGVIATHRYRGLVPALVASDALVSGGGGLLQDRTSARSLWYYLTLIRLARMLGKRVVVYGQSLGPLSPSGRDHVTQALRGVPLALRDGASVELARQLGLEATLVADAALLLDPPENVLPPRGATAHDTRPVLLIPRSGHEALNEALAQAASRLRRGGVRVTVIAMHPAEDADAARRLQSSVGAVLLEAADPTDALRHIAGSRYVLSVRLHGLILACLAGIGAAGLVYDPKVSAFAAEAGFPAFQDPIDPETIVALATQARPADRERREALLARARSGADWLVTTLKAKRP